MELTWENPILRVENIDVSYGDLQVLWDVSFEVNEGEIVALVGANGSGKSTTLRTISGLLTPAKGSILLQDQRLDLIPANRIIEHGIAHVPEGRHLFPEMTVRENLIMGSLTPQAKGRVERLFGVLQDRLIAEMGLWEIKKISEANIFLKEIFIKDYNHRFSLKPETAQRAWLKVPRNMDIERTISFRYQAVVGNDNAVRIGGNVIDIPEGPGQRGYAKAKVEVRQLLDGSWRVYYKDKLIAQTDSHKGGRHERAQVDRP